KCSWRARLHTISNYEFIKTVGEHENQIGNSRCVSTRTFYESLRQESEQNQTNLYNILTPANICVPDEVLVQLPTNDSLKRNFHRWRQENTTELTSVTIDFPVSSKISSNSS
ncbi:unnamed protein product, partial [Rotaria sp. Silwood1]